MTERKPRFIQNHILKGTISLDSASFLYRDGEADPLFCIADRYSNFVKGEDPKVRLSLIKEGPRDFQLRIAVLDGHDRRPGYHTERPRYYSIDPNNWLEWGWIIFPKSSFKELLEFLFRCIEMITIEEK